MTVMAQAPPSQGGRAGSLYDTLELILDKGLVIDVFASVSLIGIEILRVQVRVVIASVDTYLRFAAALNQMELEQRQARDALAALTPKPLTNGFSTEPPFIEEPVPARTRSRSTR